MEYNLLNTIFILNYKRPKIKTIDTLKKIWYDGDIVIIMEDSDPFIEEVKRKYRNCEIEVIHKEDYMSRDGFMDNFDDTKCVYANRNASRVIAEKRGLIRYWLFDDDYNGFCHVRSTGRTRTIKEGKTLKALLSAISSLGYKSNAANVGFSQAVANFKKYATSKKVYNFHNLPADERLFVPYYGRTNEDMVQSMECNMTGKFIMAFTNLRAAMEPPEKQTGGLTEIYKQDGQYNKSYYAVLQNPGIAKIKKQFVGLNRYYHKVAMAKIAPKIIPERCVKAIE